MSKPLIDAQGRPLQTIDLNGIESILKVVLVDTDGNPVSIVTGGGFNGTYVFTQGSPSDTWTIHHAMGKYPSVTIEDSTGEIIIPAAIDYSLGVDDVIIGFEGSPVSGIAYLN